MLMDQCDGKYRFVTVLVYWMFVIQDEIFLGETAVEKNSIFTCFGVHRPGKTRDA